MVANQDSSTGILTTTMEASLTTQNTTSWTDMSASIFFLTEYSSAHFRAMLSHGIGNELIFEATGDQDGMTAWRRVLGLHQGFAQNRHRLMNTWTWARDEDFVTAFLHLHG